MKTIRKALNGRSINVDNLDEVYIYVCIYMYI